MRLLVVDDEVRLAESVARALRAEGFDVDVVHNGARSALAGPGGRLRGDHPRHHAPREERVSRCAATSAPPAIATPILMLTAKDGEYDEAEALDTGADDYLRKPFSLVVLIARLRALLRRGPVPAVDATRGR